MFPVNFNSCDKILSRSLDQIGFKDSVASAKEFAKLYNEYKNKTNIEKCVLDFVKTDCNKNYWVGIFLYEPFFTDIQNYPLAEKIFQSGIKRCSTTCDEIRFKAMFGLLLMRQKKLNYAKKNFVEAADANKKTQGECWPAMTEEESNFIEKEFGVKP